VLQKIDLCPKKQQLFVKTHYSKATPKLGTFASTTKEVCNPNLTKKIQTLEENLEHKEHTLEEIQIGREKVKQYQSWLLANNSE